MTVQICHTGRDPATELEQLHTLIANRVGTIIVAGSGYVDNSIQAATRRELDMFRRNGGRVAAIGRHHLGVDSVRPDNVAGGESIARHLVDLGHRRIAIAAESHELLLAFRWNGAVRTGTVGEPIAAVVTHGAVIAAGISLVRRFRRSTGVERQQLRWVAFSAIVAAAAVVVAFVAAVADEQVLLGVAALIAITAVPAGVTIGVFRFRLYDLDRVVSRSVVFALLTALVAAVYAVVVLVVGGLVGRGQLTSGVAA